MLVSLFIICIKDFFKFLFVYNIAVIISFGYFAYNIITFFFVNIYLARDLFRELKVDF